MTSPKKNIEPIVKLFGKYDKNYNFQRINYEYLNDALEIDGKQGSLPFYFYKANISDKNGELNTIMINKSIKNLTENLNKVKPLSYNEFEYNGVKLELGNNYQEYVLKTVEDMLDSKRNEEMYDDVLMSLSNRANNLIVIEDNENSEYYFLGEKDFFKILDEITETLKNEMKETNSEKSVQKERKKVSMS